MDEHIWDLAWIWAPFEDLMCLITFPLLSVDIELDERKRMKETILEAETELDALQP